MGYKDMVLGTLTQTAIDEHDNVYFKMAQEVEEVYRKTQAFDNVRSFITKRLKEEKTTDEYDFGERFICEEIERLLEDKQND